MAPVKGCDMFCETDLKNHGFETALIILAAKKEPVLFECPALVLQLFVLCNLPTQRPCCELAKVARM